MSDEMTKKSADPKINIDDLPQDEKARKEEAAKVVGGAGVLQQTFDPKNIVSPVMTEEKKVGLVGK